MGKRDKAGPSTSASASGSSPKRARKDEDASAEDDVPTQWEFDFGDEKPNAQELLELAVEEKSEGNSEAAVRLFELALEAFPKEEEEAVKGDKDDVARFLFDWATCLRELGEYLPLRDYLQDAAARLQALAADGTASIAGDVSVSQARTRLALAHLLQETARKQAETLAEEGTEMDKAAEEEQEKMRKDAAEQLKMGSDLYKAAIAAIATKLQGRIASETSIFARYLINFFNVADEEQRQDLLDEALALTQTATSAKPRDDFVLSVRSDALLAAARHLAQQDKTEEALAKAQEAASTFEGALASVDEEERHVDTLKGLADAYVLLATLDADEDKVMQYFDKARERLKETLKLSPDFAEAREQLEALGGAQSDEEEEEEE